MSSTEKAPRKMQDFEQVLEGSDTNVAAFAETESSLIKKLQSFLHSTPTIVPVIVLIVSVVTFGLIAGEKFFSPFNLSLIIQQVSIIGILAAAQSLIILTAGIDLSIAASMVLMSVISGKLAVEYGVPAPLAILISLAAGTAAGLLNGFLITRVKLPPFITTLGTWNIFYALLLWLSGAQSIRGADIDEQAPMLKWFGEKANDHVLKLIAPDYESATNESAFLYLIDQFNVTYGVLLMILVFGVLWYMLNKTAWGRHVYAVGDDKEAAELAGIRADRTLVSVYAVAGLVAAIGAWASIGRVGSISPTSFYEGNLQSITAVVIGGISLFGGRGSILGALFGALIVGVFQSGLRLAGVDVLWQVFAIGWLIIIAVAIDQWIRKVSA